MRKAFLDIRYPIYARKMTWIEKIAKISHALPIHCTICGSLTIARVTNDNFRENVYCLACHSFNRQRQLALVFLNAIANRRIKTLKEITAIDYLSLFNTETGGVLHNFLSQMKGYVCSEYFGSEYASGEYIDNRMHQDLMSLSFPDNQFDIVITTDVMEHVKDPYIAQKEIYRILKPGGRHIFTVPFYQTEILDETRAAQNQNGETVYNMEPIYHVDPLRQEGILVYNIFSIEMLVKLSKIGFRTNMHHLYRPTNGIIGPNALVFESIKEAR